LRAFEPLVRSAVVAMAEQLWAAPGPGSERGLLPRKLSRLSESLH